MFTATDWIRDKNGLMVLTPFPIKWAGKAAKQVYHKLRQKDTGNEATSRTFLQRKGSVLVQPLSLTSFDSSPSRGASGEEEKFSAMPKPPLQGATATTAASGGNREELLGQRPAGCERERSRCWEPQPDLGAKRPERANSAGTATGRAGNPDPRSSHPGRALPASGGTPPRQGGSIPQRSRWTKPAAG